MKRRNLILLLGGTGSAALSTGTGAFSSMEAERDVEVNVVNDDQAFVGYHTEDRVLPEDANGDGKFDIVTVENQFSKSVSIEITDVEITVEADGQKGPEITDLEYGEQLGSGDAETVRGTLDTEKAGEWTVEATVTVEGTADGVSARIFGDTSTRSFMLKREPPEDNTGNAPDGPIEITGVSYSGNGKVTIYGSRDGETEVVFYLRENGRPNSPRPVWSETRTAPINGDESDVKKTGVSGKRIVAVGGMGSEEVYLHPNWNQNECKFGNSGSGEGLPSDADPSSCN